VYLCPEKMRAIISSGDSSPDHFTFSFFLGFSNEKNFSPYCGVCQAVASANITDAVKLALQAVGVQAGDKC